MAKHTPGPWMAHQNDNNDYEIMTANDAHISIGVVYGENQGGMGEADPEQFRSDAWLVAAAPELLEVLQNLMPLLGAGLNALEPRAKEIEAAEPAVAKTSRA